MAPGKEGPQGKAAAAGEKAPADGSAAGSKPAAVKKVLVFMSTTSRNLIDLARSGQVKLRGALESALRADEGPGGSSHYQNGSRAVELHVLVHGFQVEGTNELGSMEFTFGIDENGFGWTWPEQSRPVFIPGDATVIGSWVGRKLSLSPARRLDSTMLIFWGHGLGVGTTLTLPRDVPGAEVPPPGLANIGGLREEALIPELERGLDRGKAGERAEAADGPPSKIDILLFDSCLMASVELASEYSNLARFLVASQSLVDTAPGGPPGLNLGEVLAAFLRDDAWCHDVPPNERIRRLRDTTAAMADLVGETKSGAQQLTVFALERCRTTNASSQVESATRWLEDRFEQGDLGLTFIEKAMSALDDRLKSPRDGPPPQLGLVGLLWLFARLLGFASEDAAERQRVVLAFRGALFGRARQFLDLRDLAFQVHQVSQSLRLQIVALALFNELTPRRDGIVVAHRAAARIEEKLRIGGSSVFCPWFRAHPGEHDGVFNVNIDGPRYRSLKLPDVSGWAAFAFGPMFEATAGEREPPLPPVQEDQSCCRLLEQLLREHLNCPHGPMGGAGASMGGKPSGGPLGGKPSGGPLGGKPSGSTLGGKPSGDTLGPPFEA
jgi:hypothetical protein